MTIRFMLGILLIMGILNNPLAPQENFQKKTILKGVLPEVPTHTPRIIASGNYPDVAVGRDGNIHVVYTRGHQLYYKRFTASTQKWSEEQETPVVKTESAAAINRSDPDIVVDFEGQPHVFAWSNYAWLAETGWVKIDPLPRGETRYRDTELAIDHKGVIFLARRSGFHEGNIGVQRLIPGSHSFETVADPDQGLTSPDISNHVYPDIAISPLDNAIHLVQRHGPGNTTAYHRSTNGGKSWDLHSIVCKSERESPHIVINYLGQVFVINGLGEFFRLEDQNWTSEGYPLHCQAREQPEMAVDRKNNIYVACFGGKYNIRNKGDWSAEKQIESLTGQPIGFVEPAGLFNEGAVFVWEEGKEVNADELVEEAAHIVVGRINTKGEVGYIGTSSGEQAGKFYSK
jgi:hypothetical protein